MSVYHVIILDESGSMSSVRKETLQYMKEVLSGIRKSQETFPDQAHLVTVVTFAGSGTDGVRVRCEQIPAGMIDDLAETEYRPGGSTPLYDAMGQTLSGLEPFVHPEDRVIVTVITDGYENASGVYARSSITELVDGLEKKGWIFAYIGANLDAVEEARNIHIDNALDFRATPEEETMVNCRLKKDYRKQRDQLRRFFDEFARALLEDSKNK